MAYIVTCLWHRSPGSLFGPHQWSWRETRYRIEQRSKKEGRKEECDVTREKASLVAHWKSTTGQRSKKEFRRIKAPFSRCVVVTEGQKKTGIGQ